MKISCPLGFIGCSDAHIAPAGQIPLVLYDLSAECYRKNTPLVIAGDLLDLIIYGRKAYRDSPMIPVLRALWRDITVYLIVGNHEVKTSWLRSLFPGRRVHVCQSLDVDVNGHPWHIEHGDRYSVDWAWLRPLYTWAALTMLYVSPRLWLRICRRWRPTALLADPSERDKYTRLVGLIRYNALNDAVARKASVIIGHTHLAGSIEQSGLQVLDGGDARDGNYWTVGPDGQGQIMPEVN